MTGISLLSELTDTAWSVVMAVLPLAALFVAFQLFLLGLPRKQIRGILIGTLFATAGLFLFLLGVGIGFLPFGRVIGAALGGMQEPWVLLAVGLFLGFVTTWGEPAVRILAGEIEHASNGSIPQSLVVSTICIGVSVSVALGLLRIVYEISILYLLVPGYALAVILTWLSSKEFVAIAIDSGGVATGPLANTFLLALALGASASNGTQDVMVQGLGLVALIALAPILSVMLLGLLIRWKASAKV